MHKVAIIGAGTVGTALGCLLRQGGYSVVCVASRTLESADKARRFIGEGEAATDLATISRRANIVFITTSDSAIQEVCIKIASAGGFNPGAIVFHTCGALSSEILDAARDSGAYVASLHPLQSLANVQEAVKNLPGSYFSIEGDEVALSAARKVIAVLNGEEISLEFGKKALYHAGAAVSSNFLVATVSFALELFEAAGISRKDSLHALMPLINGTVKNIETIGIPFALTGPISRGDIGIVEDHLKAISKESPGLLGLYAELGRQTVKVALEKGTLKEDAADRINSLLKYYKQDNLK